MKLMISEKAAWVVFPRSTPTGLLHYSNLPIFINATTRQQISIYSIGPYWYLLACTPTFGKSGGTKFFSCRDPHLKIRGAALLVTRDHRPFSPKLPYVPLEFGYNFISILTAVVSAYKDPCCPAVGLLYFFYNCIHVLKMILSNDDCNA